MTLEEMVTDYLSGQTIDDFNSQLDYYRSLDSLESAIENACFGFYKVNDVLYHSSHYDRIYKNGFQALIGARNALISSIDRIASTDNFDDLFNIVNERITSITGIGNLMHYDITLRIGAFKKLSPTKVHGQRGSRWGMEALYGAQKDEWEDNEPIILNREELVENFHALSRIIEPSLIENFLCVYHSELFKLK